jgi:aryl sulfotransferase
MFSNMHHTRTWWPHRELDNVLLVHYNDLKRDLPGEIQRLGAFLDIAVSDTQAKEVATSSHIDAMRERAIENGDGMKGGFKGGARTFFYKGTNERWRGVLTDDDLELYEQAKQRVLSPDCAEWLENGWLGLS